MPKRWTVERTFAWLPLENRFPAWDPTQGAPDGIVVLGGAIRQDISAARGQIALAEAAERITAAVELARHYPAARIIFSGANSNLFLQNPIEANFAGRMWENPGVVPNRSILEKRSRGTAENAAFTEQLVAPKPGERWLLITSALHMPRAMGAFRKVGFPAEAYPVDYQTTGPRDLLSISDSLMGGNPLTDAAVHEWLGFWLTG